jgi:uncharacterized membrane protein YoaK (UPF0700 family)
MERAGRSLVADPRHGPLPLALLALTVVTGMVDAVSILSLGRVFVANMTGNVVFIGFAVARAPGFSLSASLVALLGFLIGAAAGGGAARRLGADRAVLLAAGAATELALLAAAALAAAFAGEPFGSAIGNGLAGLCALAMGVQNAVARHLAVPDLTTTVLTMTLTGLAADVDPESRRRSLPRRLLAIAAMLAGAFAGAELVLHVSAASALGVLVALLAAVAAYAAIATRRPGNWRRGTALSQMGRS